MSNSQTEFNKRIELLKKHYKAKTLKKVVVEYNKSIRKKTIKALGKMKRAEVEKVIAKQMRLIDKKNGKAHQFRDKDGRFTKIVMKDYE